MPLYLNISYNEKDEAKDLGAKWDPLLKQWYVNNRSIYHNFHKWILQDCWEKVVVCNQFYIIEGKRKCFKCSLETEVIGFGIDNYLKLMETDEKDINHSWKRDVVRIVSSLAPLPEELLKYLKETYNYYCSYSKTTETSYYANHCKHCNVIQGHFFVFSEGESPFLIDSIEKAKRLTLHRVKIKNDLIMDADIAYCSTDELIKEYSKIVELNHNFNL